MGWFSNVADGLRRLTAWVRGAEDDCPDDGRDAATCPADPADCELCSGDCWDHRNVDARHDEEE